MEDIVFLLYLIWLQWNPMTLKTLTATSN